MYLFGKQRKKRQSSRGTGSHPNSCGWKPEVKDSRPLVWVSGTPVQAACRDPESGCGDGAESCGCLTSGPNDHPETQECKKKSSQILVAEIQLADQKPLRPALHETSPTT